MRAAALAARRRSARRARRSVAAAQPCQSDLSARCRRCSGDIEAFQASEDLCSSRAARPTSRRRRQRADRPGRQQDRHPGAARPRLRRAHRAGRRLRARPLPHRRRAAAKSSSCRRRWRQALVSRIKIMADMNIVERRRPQDGQFEMRIDNRDLDVPRLARRRRSGARRRCCGCSTAPVRSTGSPTSACRPSRASCTRSIVQSPFGMVDRRRPDRQRQDHDALRDVVGDQPAPTST